MVRCLDGPPPRLLDFNIARPVADAVTLHEAVTGRLPDPGEGAPGPLGAILSAALDPEPARRPTAAALGARLRPVAGAIAAADRASAASD